MKRHPQLQPLSRQHHNGLLMVLLLKKGVAKAAYLPVMNQFIIDNWQMELKYHFEMEETILLPALKRSGFDSKLTERLLQEHHNIRTIIEKSRENVGGIDTIIDFYTQLENHIRFEEKELFPAAERCLTEKKLQQIGKYLTEDLSKNCLQYPVKFWE